MAVSPRLLLLLAVLGGAVALVVLVLGYALRWELPDELQGTLMSVVVGAAWLLKSPVAAPPPVAKPAELPESVSDAELRR